MIPFLRPQVAPLSTYAHLIERIDETHLYSNYGPLNGEFESRMASEMFGGHGSCVTMNNATSGLALALRLLARPGKYVIMPSFTFAATPLAARWAGFEPYFVDVDPSTWMIDESRVQEALALLGEEVAAVMPYATFGNNLDLNFYAELHRSGTPVIVDAAASLGSKVDGAQFGRGFPGVVVYSMHATKPFSVGEAGLVYSADADAIAKLRRGGNFGFGVERAAVDDGFNTKLPEIMAAVALATLDRFAERMEQRASIYEEYKKAISDIDLQGWSLQAVQGEVVHQFFPVLAPAGVSGDDVVAQLDERNIQARRYFAPACHQQSAFATAARGPLEVTEQLAHRIVSLPLWDGLTPDVVRTVVGAVRES